MSHPTAPAVTPQTPSASGILAAVADLARRKVGWEGAVTPEMRLVEDLSLDSIHLLTLAVEVEDHFHICLEEDDEAGLETVGDLVAVVERKLAAGGASEATSAPGASP
jgi:acyl carrier protein